MAKNADDQSAPGNGGSGPSEQKVDSAKTIATFDVGDLARKGEAGVWQSGDKGSLDVGG